MASIMAVESSGDVETNLSGVDKKYDLVRRLAQTGISYVLVARDPSRISRRGLLSRARKKRKTTSDEEKLVKPTFHLNMDYEALGKLEEIRSDSADLPRNPNTSSLPPIAGLIICTLSALSRTIPRQIFQELSHALYLKFETIEGLRVLSISSLAHIQVLLLLTMNPETQSPATNHSGSMTFLRIGTAIRMAQDLGLHRCLGEQDIPVAQLARRRRVWAACVIVDKCIENFDHAEFIRLRAEVLHWPNTLPPQLAFTLDAPSTRAGELLRVFYIPLVFATFRAYDVTSKEWTVLVRHSQKAIDWLSIHGAPILDIWWFVVVIGFVWSALMQFYAACLNDDVVALSYLARAMSMATSWARPADSHVENDGHSDGEFRVKIVTLLELMHQVAHRRIRLSQAMRSQSGIMQSGAATFAIPESSDPALQRPTQYYLTERTAPFASTMDGSLQNAGSSYAVPNLSVNDAFDWPLADFSLEGNASSEEFWNSMIAYMEDVLF
ncbi:hypothetical protein QFC21_002178 [Naganishia friedmannii]|uniref:Uncharacterized protein n=1 Tax=Naganishia friedmannii TaxID=89922 RepID=A0ACC2VYW8_9TREE|nr:hypothetical protein QFC21_002178 [Naganishia friedmannii]